MTSRLEFERENSEHEKGVATNRQDSGDLDSPVDLAVRRKIGAHGEEFTCSGAVWNDYRQFDLLIMPDGRRNVAIAIVDAVVLHSNVYPAAGPIL